MDGVIQARTWKNIKTKKFDSRAAPGPQTPDPSTPRRPTPRHQTRHLDDTWRRVDIADVHNTLNAAKRIGFDYVSSYYEMMDVHQSE